MSIDKLAAVREFHDTIGGPTSNADHPTVPSLDIRALRARLIAEEYREFVEASGLWEDPDGTGEYYAEREPDLVAVADALGDLLYVVYGAAAVYGLPIDEIFEEIHRSNMTKGGGPVRADGKVMKPDTFSPPNLVPILARALPPEAA